MGTKTSCKTATVMGLIGKGPVKEHIQAAQPTQGWDLEAATKKVLAAKKAEGEAILILGNELIEVKARLTHGEWLEWLERVDIKPRVAQRHMMLAQRYSNASTLTYLGASKALELLSIPDETERDMYIEAPHVVNGEEKMVGDMSVRELRAALKERDEALKAAAQAQAEQSAAEQAREKLSADMALANERIAGLNAEVEAKTAAAARLEKELEYLRSRPVDVAVETDPAAIETARKEAEAAMKGKLDKARAAERKARDNLIELNSALQQAKLERERTEIELRKQLAQAEKKAALSSSEDLVLFRMLLDQAQEAVNKLSGVLMKVHPKDPRQAQEMSDDLLAFGDKIKEAAIRWKNS